MPMGLLSKNTEPTKDTPEKVKVKRTETKEKKYTVHTAEIHYSNEEIEEVIFDEMIREKNCVILKNYTGYYTSSFGSGFESQAFMTLPYTNFNHIKTTNRKKDSFEYEETKTLHKKPENVTEEEEIV